MLRRRSRTDRLQPSDPLTQELQLLPAASRQTDDLSVAATEEKKKRQPAAIRGASGGPSQSRSSVRLPEDKAAKRVLDPDASFFWETEIIILLIIII